MISKKLRQSPRFWIGGFVVWFIVLNLLSHGDKFHPPGSFAFDIPHFDKLVHFGYFFGGSGLLSAALFFSSPPSWRRLILTVTISLSVIGIWDEFHQSFFENRTGNDPGDWFADTLGAFCGAIVFLKLHPRLL
jgi:VanZ family protein